MPIDNLISARRNNVKERIEGRKYVRFGIEKMCWKHFGKTFTQHWMMNDDKQNEGLILDTNQSKFIVSENLIY